MSSLSAQSLHKNERLHSKNDIDRLLSKGRFFVVDNVFRCCVLPRSADGSGVTGVGSAGVTGAAGSGVVAGSGVTGVAVGNGSASSRMMVSVPKKCFKRAVKRNLLKRRIREAYRRNKPSLPMDILFVYLPKEILSYEQIEQTLIRAIERAEEKLRTFTSTSAATNAQADRASATNASATSASATDAQAASSDSHSSQKEVAQGSVAQNKLVAVLKWIGNAPFLLLISFYRACVSPFTPPACRFTPTCSQYAMEAFKKYGPFKGLYLTVKRILRCRPGGGSGYDPVP